jgi:hypothetical protein
VLLFGAEFNATADPATETDSTAAGETGDRNPAES